MSLKYYKKYLDSYEKEIDMGGIIIDNDDVRHADAIWNLAMVWDAPDPTEKTLRELGYYDELEKERKEEEEYLEWERQQNAKEE